MELTQKEKELLLRILSDVQPDSIMGITTGYTPPAEMLRRQADQIERKEKDIRDFSILVNKLVTPQSTASKQ